MEEQRAPFQNWYRETYIRVYKAQRTRAGSTNSPFRISFSLGTPSYGNSYHPSHHPLSPSRSMSRIKRRSLASTRLKAHFRVPRSCHARHDIECDDATRRGKCTGTTLRIRKRSARHECLVASLTPHARAKARAGAHRGARCIKARQPASRCLNFGNLAQRGVRPSTMITMLFVNSDARSDRIDRDDDDDDDRRR